MGGEGAEAVLPAPSYCPHLNPIEGVWRRLKGFLMPRRFYDSLAELKQAVLSALESAAGTAREKVGQLSRKRTRPSAADERVILLSSLLVALSAGREAPELLEAFGTAKMSI